MSRIIYEVVWRPRGGRAITNHAASVVAFEGVVRNAIRLRNPDAMVVYLRHLDPQLDLDMLPMTLIAMTLDGRIFAGGQPTRLQIGHWEAPATGLDAEAIIAEVAAAVAAGNDDTKGS